MPKIAYVGSFKKLWNEEGNAIALERIGCEVLRLPEETFRFEEYIGKIKEFNPDFVLFAKVKISGVPNIFLQKVKDLGFKTVSWTFDLFFGLSREWRIGLDAMFKCDLVLSPDGAHDDLFFKTAGVNHKLLRQGIFDDYCYKGKFNKELDYDIVFVGCSNSEWKYRDDLCKFLEKNYKSFKWFGKHDTLDIRGDALNDLYASAKIVMGDSVYSPYYWSNRIYETLGRGGFMIHPKVEGLEEDYTPYEHFIPYTLGDWGGLKEKIDYFLQKPEERKKIGDAALKHTKEHHLLTHRVKKLLQCV